MKAWRCGQCSGMWGVALVRCPRCHAEDWTEEDPMPKASRAAGATNAGATVRVKKVLGDQEAGRLVDRLAGQETVEGGEQPSVGTSSEASSRKPSQSTKRSGRSRRQPAPTTESLSSEDGTESFTARSTGGGRVTGTSADDVEES